MENHSAIWLRRRGDTVEVLIEHNGYWVTLIEEHADGPFSHIIETGGIAKRIADPKNRSNFPSR